jgi:predicted transcriptional regulator
MNGNELRKLRRGTLDLTQAALAAELGLRPDTVSRYETGTLAIPKTVELAVEALVVRSERGESGALNGGHGT